MQRSLLVFGLLAATGEGFQRGQPGFSRGPGRQRWTRWQGPERWTGGRSIVKASASRSSVDLEIGSAEETELRAFYKEVPPVRARDFDPPLPDMIPSR